MAEAVDGWLARLNGSAMRDRRNGGYARHLLLRAKVRGAVSEECADGMAEKTDAPRRQHNADRMRRADAWLQRSRAEDTEDIERFIFLWIAFNAAYGDEDAMRDFAEAPVGQPSEAARFNTFLLRIVRNDPDRVLYGILWERYSGPIRKLLNNPYVYRPFWRAVQRGGGDGWRERLAADNREVERAVASRDSFAILTRIFRRLYTLRNQIFHGGATWPAGFGRDQIRDGSNIMAALVPAILDIMRRDLEQNPDSDRWGRVAYPRINDRPE